jgi:HPt (histidine-containing phosphotransfer) domain-containing protein
MEGYRFVNIEQLNEMAEGNDELINDLVNLFFKQVPVFSEQLDTFYKSGDFLSLGRLAHKIKGSVSMLGITELADYMKELENLAKENLHAEKYPDLINKYKTISTKAVEELKDIINRH